MNVWKTTLTIAALAILALIATACGKTDSSTSGSANTSPAKSSSSTSTASATVSKRFVGTWVEEDRKSDQGTRFTDDGKVIELESNKVVGTYTTTGDDKATINMVEGGVAAEATLESDSRMKMVVGKETAFLKKKS